MRTPGRTYRVDLTHLLDEDGFPPVDAPRRLLNALAFYGSIVKAGSCYPAGIWFRSTVRCRRRGASARLFIAHETDGRIAWECPECGDNGRISDWQGGRYDLSVAVELDSSRRVGVYIAPKDHDLLREIALAEPEEEAVIAGGVVTEQGVWISGRAKDFEDLLGSLAAEANHTRNVRRREALDRIADEIEALVDVVASE